MWIDMETPLPKGLFKSSGESRPIGVEIMWSRHCYATHASNALNKWFEKDFGAMTAHSLSHTMRDRLRAVEWPMDMIDQLYYISGASLIQISE